MISSGSGTATPPVPVCFAVTLLWNLGIPFARILYATPTNSCYALSTLMSNSKSLGTPPNSLPGKTTIILSTTCWSAQSKKTPIRWIRRCYASLSRLSRTSYALKLCRTLQLLQTQKSRWIYAPGTSVLTPALLHAQRFSPSSPSFPWNHLPRCKTFLRLRPHRPLKWSHQFLLSFSSWTCFFVWVTCLSGLWAPFRSKIVKAIYKICDRHWWVFAKFLRGWPAWIRSWKFLQCRAWTYLTSAHWRCFCHWASDCWKCPEWH